MSVRDIAIGRYIHGSSVLHGLDPRTKILSLIAVTVVLFSRDRAASVLMAGVFAFTACLLSGIGPKFLIKSLLPFKWLIILTIVLKAVFVGGTILVRAPLPFGGVTVEGLQAGLLYGGRIALLVLTASLLTFTTEPIVLVDGIEKLMRPLARVGVHPHDTALAMVITIRFIPILFDEAEKIRKSFVARGFSPTGGIGLRLRYLAMLILPLFHSAVRRAETLAVAMDCRLYRSGETRTRFNETTMRRRDAAALAVSVLFAIFGFVL